jgi:7,8-dihydropterin-6-yl-methyl-4-(beta-D-ribofuranosyl)aminobenzene 5'-phosphate synthase
MSQTKITVIYDNRCANEALQEGWGFSVFVENEDRKILFDTGGYSPAFFSNIEKLQIPLEKVTHLLFSHRHWDHKAGMDEVLSRLNEKAQVYVPRLFSPFRTKLKRVRSFVEIDRGIYSLVLKGGFLLYEQALILNTAQGMVIITGCAHPGIITIIKKAQERLPGKVYFVMGGFHLLFDPAPQSAKVVQEFQTLGVQKVAPCHCSGDQTIRQFQAAYGDHFCKVGTGTVVTV